MMLIYLKKKPHKFHIKELLKDDILCQQYQIKQQLRSSRNFLTKEFENDNLCIECVARAYGRGIIYVNEKNSAKEEIKDPGGETEREIVGTL